MPAAGETDYSTDHGRLDRMRKLRQQQGKGRNPNKTLEHSVSILSLKWIPFLTEPAWLLTVLRLERLETLHLHTDARLLLRPGTDVRRLLLGTRTRGIAGSKVPLFVCLFLCKFVV